MTHVIPKLNFRGQALEAVGSSASDRSEESQTQKPSPPSSTDGTSGQKKRPLKSRKRPDREMRNRCKMVADWIEVMGPSAFTSIVGCDMEYLRALLQDKVNITNTILDKK